VRYWSWFGPAPPLGGPHYLAGLRRGSATTNSDARVCHAKAAMRDPETIETELMEISAIPDDLVKFERIVAWCATHPDEVPFALHQMMRQREYPEAGSTSE